MYIILPGFGDHDQLQLPAFQISPTSHSFKASEWATGAEPLKRWKEKSFDQTPMVNHLTAGLPFSPKIHRLCMLVVKKVGVWVTHIRKSVTARLMINMLAGVLKLLLLQKHVQTSVRNEVDMKDEQGEVNKESKAGRNFLDSLSWGSSTAHFCVQRYCPSFVSWGGIGHIAEALEQIFWWNSRIMGKL